MLFKQFCTKLKKQENLQSKIDSISNEISKATTAQIFDNYNRYLNNEDFKG